MAVPLLEKSAGCNHSVSKCSPGTCGSQRNTYPARVTARGISTNLMRLDAGCTADRVCLRSGQWPEDTSSIWLVLAVWLLVTAGLHVVISALECHSATAAPYLSTKRCTHC